MPIDKDIIQTTPTAIEQAAKIIQDKYKLNIFGKYDIESLIYDYLKDKKLIL